MQQDIGSSPLQTIRRVIDQRLAERLQELRDRESLTCWDLGKLINDIYARCARRKLDVTKDEVCIFVAREIDSRDRSVSSMRQYAKMAEIWSPDFVEQHPVPFSHFQEAAKFGEARKTILTLSLQLMDNRGGAQVSAEALGRYAEGMGYQRAPAEPDTPPNDLSDQSSMQTRQPEVMQRNPAFNRLRIIARELTEISRELQKDYPFWARTAAQLASLCDRITREMQEIEGTVIDN